MPITFPYFPSNGQIYTYNGENWIYTGNTWVKQVPDVNWAWNDGKGQGVFEYKTGTTIAFKSLIAGSNITLSADTDEILISSSGSTVSGDYLPLSGGTVTGNTIFLSGLSATSISATTLNLNGSQLDTSWTSYAVAWSSQNNPQPSIGDGTLTGYYKVIGKTVFVRVRLAWGSTTTGGTGAWLFSLPVNAASPHGIQLPCSILDNGNAWYQATVNGEYSGFVDKTALIGQSAGGANSSQGIDALFPFTWGTSDSLQFNGSYESA